MLEYNTKRNHLYIKEYGRNVQKMIEKAVKIEDYQKRTESARAIVRVMSQLNPEVKENPNQQKSQRESLDYWHKLWDHLFIMSNYQLDVDCPFPKPSENKETSTFEKPDYNKHHIAYRTYGRNMENIINEVSSYPSLERSELSKILANHLKKLYLSYNRDSVDDNLILAQIKEMSNGKLFLPDDFVLDSTRDILKNTPKAKYPVKINKKAKHKKKKKDQLS